jgi:hypothetical protein
LDDQDSNKDKFLIISFPVNQVISDNIEARNLIKSFNLKSEKNQEIYLETEIDKVDNNTKKKFSFADPYSINKSTDHPIENFKSFASSNLVTQPSETDITKSTINTEIDELKRQMEEIKKEIKNYDTENNKLNIQQNNLVSNSNLYRVKNKGNEFIDLFSSWK